MNLILRSCEPIYCYNVVPPTAYGNRARRATNFGKLTPGMERALQSGGNHIGQYNQTRKEGAMSTCIKY